MRIPDTDAVEGPGYRTVMSRYTSNKSKAAVVTYNCVISLSRRKTPERS